MRLFGIILRIVELILLISISVLVVCVLWTCEDKATLTDCLSESAVGLFWLFPITIPIAACLLVSLFVSLIKLVKTKNVYNKFIFGIHLFNIFVIPLTFLFLPSSGEPPTAQAMADNYYKHAEEMKCLVELIEDYVGNDGGIDYTNVNGKILTLSIKSGGKWIHQKRLMPNGKKAKPWQGYRVTNWMFWMLICMQRMFKVSTPVTDDQSLYCLGDMAILNLCMKYIGRKI